MRHARQSKVNASIADWTRRYGRQSNLKFFADAHKAERRGGRTWTGAIGLVGGRSLPAYMLRHAQSVLRWDLLPSYWSHCFLIAGTTPAIGNTPIWECSVEPTDGALSAERNGVSVAKLSRYADPSRFPNVGLMTFALTEADVKALMGAAAQPNVDRTRFNMWELLGTWMPYAWRMRTGINPLTEGLRMPSAAYVEMAYERIGVDLAPGASERNSSPEHLWQTAKWWWRSFAEVNKKVNLYSCVRQAQAELARPLPLTLR